MRIIVLKQVEKELKEAPKEIKENIISLFQDLAQGKILSMPISRSLYNIQKGLHELRLSSRAGEFRVFYFLKQNDSIYIIHAFLKKKQLIDTRTSELLRKRIRSIL
ncbi:MAG: type II toxin-antitoxin system RelE/ParE family toxin [Bacteriovorax sp.]|nr:type II toxin-antitoxin system RelE/ParE family toxin [Bacteriovorax sp.]